LALLIVASAVGPSAAEDKVRQAAVEATGKSALPLPRFVSLKSDKVNVRKGPSTDQAIVWVFSRAGLPVEVIAESDNWRRVRDSEGADGWVFHSLLSARRTALVTPWSKDEERVRLTARIPRARAPSPNSSPACSAMCCPATGNGATSRSTTIPATSSRTSCGASIKARK